MFKKFADKVWIIFLLIFNITAFADQFHSDSQAQITIPFGKSYDYNNIKVKRAIDGDTIELEAGSPVRYSGNRILSEKEAKELKRILRVIANHKIINWDGKEWLAKTEAQKKEAIKRACEAWRKARYQRIESIKYFIEDIDEYYRHFEQKNSGEGMTKKVGLVLSISAFFSGIEIMVE